MNNQDELWLLKEKYRGEKSEAFFADCKRLALGEPLAYLIGHIPFLSCTIYLDEHPLSPRAETEFWVEKAIASVQEKQRLQSNLFSKPANLIATNETAQACSLQILDLCAGSGCIGVAVLKHVPEACVDFSEIDARLLPTIRKNIETNSNPLRTFVYHSNLFAGLPEHKTYEYIFSNPPYIDPALDRATESVKTHEPHLALYGGPNGMHIISDIIVCATSYLAPGGQLWLEHEPEQSALIASLATTHGYTCETHHDQYKQARYSILMLQ